LALPAQSLGRLTVARSWSPSATIGLKLSVGARIGRSDTLAALPRWALSALTMYVNWFSAAPEPRSCGATVIDAVGGSAAAAGFAPAPMM
jgi:hypothetical protein